MVNRIYLDNRTTTQLDPQVLEEMSPLLQRGWGISTQIHSFGREAKKALEEARGRIVQTLGIMQEELIFTSGGTEANNLAILGVARNLGYKGHIITSQIEHPSILETCKALQSEGHDVTFIPVSKEGLLDPDGIKKAITKKTFLISAVLAEGETGAIQPVEEVALLAKERGILFHTDACQAMGKVKLPLEGPSIDLLSLSAHKFHGPKGVGALFVRMGTRIKPILFGGSEERGLRPGTVSPALAVGMARAAELAEEQRSTAVPRVRLLEEQLLEGIRGVFEEVRLNGPAYIPAGNDSRHRLPGHLSLTFPGLEAEALLLSLDLEGIAVDAGRPCDSGAMEVSPVLLALGLSREEALSSLHISLSRFTTSDEVARAVGVLSTVISRMRIAHV